VIVSDSKKFVCFRPWKCASTTLTKRLRAYDNGKFPASPTEYEGFEGKLSKHSWTIENFLKLPESQLGYFSFVFLRNPYDRAYSGFLQRKQRVAKINPEGGEFKAIEKGFQSFLEFWLKRFEDRGQVIGNLMNEYVEYEGRRWVDYVGHLETFESDLNEVFEKLGVNSDSRGEKKPNANVRASVDTLSSDGRENASYRYLDEYTQETVSLVNHLAARDFKSTDYRKIEPAEIEALQRAGVKPTPFA
jgi:hypothetical protein